MRAAPWALEVRIGNCQPCQGLERDGQQAGADLLAGRHHRVVFARVMQRGRFPAPIDQLVGGPGHGGDHHGDLVTGRHLALDVACDIADAVDVGDRGAAELHHEAGHRLDLYGLDSGVAAGAALAQAPGRKGAYTYRREFVAATAP
jgi:hypothetical protein